MTAGLLDRAALEGLLAGPGCRNAQARVEPPAKGTPGPQGHAAVLGQPRDGGHTPPHRGGGPASLGTVTALEKLLSAGDWYSERSV